MITSSFEHAHVSQAQRTRYARRLSLYIDHIKRVVKSKKYLAPESSVVLPGDRQVVQQVKQLANAMCSRNLKYIVLVGIGGSNLGTKAIYDAIYGHGDMFHPERYPKLICLDTCDRSLIDDAVRQLKDTVTSKEEYLINIISKSGSTSETAANMAYLTQAAAKKLTGFQERIVLTTDRASILWELGKERDYAVLEIPKQVGGRYSVFSAVGLFPLMCLGINVEALCKGAQWSIKQNTGHINRSASALSAMALTHYYVKGGRIHDTFFFDPALETVGKWYRQLFAESLGKVPSNTSRHEAINMTPTVSIGTTDLHSMAQLYLANPFSRFTTFVAVRDVSHAPRLVRNDWTDLVRGLQGNTIPSLMNTIYRGVVQTYTAKNMPLASIELKERSEFALGALLQMKMLEVMYCAHLLGVNAFDQPHVELYKKEVRKILE